MSLSAVEAQPRPSQPAPDVGRGSPDFAVVTSDPVEPENTLLLAGDRASAGHPALPTDLPPELTGPAQTARARLRPAPRGGPVWTDDRAPVEWLIDRSIVNYAARGQ